VKTFVYFVGKPKDARLNALSGDYLARASRFSPSEEREVVPGRFDPHARHPSARIIALDPNGKPVDTAGFVRIVEAAEELGRDLVFLIGGHDGLPPDWRRGELMSLSAMTFAHELARVMLAEQIYRAFATLRGHPYPR
jgi:23S rRNA (pseudouridine1915-N3)-methyltransferase